MLMHLLDGHAEEWFLARYGSAEVMRKEFIPGTRHGARITELNKNRSRLREDRTAGLYDSPDDADWYRREYQRMGDEITKLKKLPEKPSGIQMVPTGKTVADEWHAATGNAEKREMLAKFSIKVKLYPAGAKERVAITGANPYTHHQEDSNEST